MNKFTISVAVTETKTGCKVAVKKPEGSLKGISPESFMNAVSKLFANLTEEYFSQNPDQYESRVDFYNDIYQELCDYLNDKYERSVTKESLNYILNSHRDKLDSVDSFLKMLEDLSDY